MEIHSVGHIKKLFFAISLVTILFVLYSLNSNYKEDWVDLLQLANSSSRNEHLDENLIILVWHWPFGISYSLEGDVCWDNFRVPSCHLTDQKNLYYQANVVVFHNQELQDHTQHLPLTWPRLLHQKWVWVSLESPENSMDLSLYDNVFNWTMTYRRDADISIPYGELEAHAGISSSDGEVDFIAQNKSDLVCWVVSNYQPHHRRSQVYNGLKKIIPVNVYGTWNGKPLDSVSFWNTLSHCYFYLSFENSVSKDYITEKLWRNAFMTGAVPVVLGPSVEDYKAVAPPNSFIHINDFASEVELGKYLLDLVHDKQKYASYLAWRQDYVVKLLSSWPERFCRICTLHQNLSSPKVYPDLKAWVWGRMTTP